MATQGDLLLQIIENQKTDGERLARVESMQFELKTELRAVHVAQTECPARIAEMNRQVRRSALLMTGKFLAWFVGIGATVAGAITAVASMFGGQ